MDFDKELAELNAEIASNPLDFEPLIERGNLQADAGHFAEAVADYSAAITLAPDCALAWDNRGVARLYLLDYYPALADFTQALSLDPVYSFAYANRAYVYCLLRRPEWALQDARQALELQPDMAPALDVMGQALAQLNRLEDSLLYLNRAIQSDSSCVQAPFHRAQVHHRLGHFQQARSDLMLYLSLYDDQQNAAVRRHEAQELLKTLDAPDS